MADLDAPAALRALRSGAATRIERVLLGTALLRAADLPARIVAGFIDDGDGVLRGSEMQLWSEYFAGQGWHAVLLDTTGDATRVIPFRVFTNADEIQDEWLPGNFFRGAGLTLWPVE